MTAETDEARIARQEAYWTGPRLFLFGLSFLAACLVFIYILSSI